MRAKAERSKTVRHIRNIILIDSKLFQCMTTVKLRVESVRPRTQGARQSRSYTCITNLLKSRYELLRAFGFEPLTAHACSTHAYISNPTIASQHGFTTSPPHPTPTIPRTEAARNAQGCSVNGSQVLGRENLFAPPPLRKEKKNFLKRRFLTF